MKFFHLSDLHLGKRVNEFPMIEDQEFILKRILSIADEEKPDAIIIAGDIYDKSVAPVEAVTLFDYFLSRLSARKIPVFIISGNHDSPERLAFGSGLMEGSGIYIAKAYDGTLKPVTMADGFGPVDIYMLPFVKPANVRAFFPEEEITAYTDAVKAALHRAVQQNTDGQESEKDSDKTRRILITHQFVTGALRSESEEISVGGTDNVDASVFSGFDYVALGHIHGPQNISTGQAGQVIRYCGTPLKYSFSEATHDKSVTIVTMGKKGDIDVRTRPLTPRHDLREIKGTYMELTAKSYYDGTATDDYLHITLTDEEDIPDAMGKLRVIYKNLMKLDYDNKRTRTDSVITGADNVKEKTPMELLGELYELQNNRPMSEEQQSFAGKIAEEIWEGEA